MTTKLINSTEAQNSFGQLLEDISNNRVRYVVKRFGVAKAVILSFDDFVQLLDNESERERIGTVLRELRPQYKLGEVVGETKEGDSQS